jgi:hypothetical protein
VTAVLLALSRKKTCCDGHAPVTIAKAQTAIGILQYRRAKRSDPDDSPHLNGAHPKAKTRPLWTIVGRSTSCTILQKGVEFELLQCADRFQKSHAQSREIATSFKKLPRQNNKTNQCRLFFWIICWVKTLPHLQYIIQAQVLGSWQQEPKQTA